MTKTKTKFISAAELADQMSLTIREHNPKTRGEPNPLLMVLRSPGTSEEDKKLLMDFIKRTGISVVRSGKGSIRYKQGNCHWLCFVKKTDFNKAKAALIAPPVAPKEECEDEGDEGTVETNGTYKECRLCGCGPCECAPPKAKFDTESKQSVLLEAARLAAQLATVLSKLASN